MIQAGNEPNPPLMKKLFFYYFIFIFLIVLLSLITQNLSFNSHNVEFIGTWLLISELVIGFAAAGSMSILTSMTTLQAKGEPVTEKNLIRQRMKEENQSFRKPWLILLIINTSFLILTSIVLFSS